MKNSLAIHGGEPVLTEGGTFDWPILDKESEKAILDQLHTSISIYDRSGVIEEFEDKFKNYHSRQYGLLSNSGTSAIFSMFEAINLIPGDEVVCPVYTFHASVSPMMYTGAIPVFADCDDEGNVSLESITAKLTDKTKAVVVTHMWGVPARDIAKIRELCDERGLWLLEDCSHAHGASIDGKKVGSFGHAASWSLQGQKIITGGEGGIMLTDDRKLYQRALLQGHYNKRPKQELDQDDELHEFYLTGMGLKLRAHPIATALALQQFNHLDEFIAQKQKFAERLNQELKDIPFLHLPTMSKSTQHSWYAYNLMYNREAAFGVSREEFVDALLAEGLKEADIPGSTGLINNLPLFTNPQKILPRMYTSSLPAQMDFPGADSIYNGIIKFPVWVRAEDEDIVESYIAGIRKVSQYLLSNHTLNA